MLYPEFCLKRFWSGHVGDGALYGVGSILVGPGIQRQPVRMKTETRFSCEHWSSGRTAVGPGLQGAQHPAPVGWSHPSSWGWAMGPWASSAPRPRDGSVMTNSAPSSSEPEDQAKDLKSDTEDTIW